jgi:hypothetical protein
VKGVWVVWDAICEGWGGCDRVFETEADARAYFTAPEQSMDRKYLKVTFVPWGDYALSADERRTIG